MNDTTSGFRARSSVGESIRLRSSGRTAAVGQEVSPRAARARTLLAALVEANSDTATAHAVATLCGSRVSTERASWSGTVDCVLSGEGSLARVAFLRRGQGVEMLVEADVLVSGAGWRVASSTAVWIRWDRHGGRDMVGASCPLLDVERDDIAALYDGWLDDAADLRAEGAHA